MTHIIEMHSLQKSFASTCALRDLSFTMREGEIFGFLGPSGAGKTTTIKILTGQLRPSGGRASTLGRDCCKLTADDFAGIGIISDNSGLYGRLSALDNLLFFGKLWGLPASRSKQVLSEVGLEEAAKTPAAKLSRGMLQRLHLARALLHQPKLLFLDEPTGGLDPSTAQQIHSLLRAVHSQGTSIFLTTHNMEEATKLCDRVALLNEGVIAELDSPRALCLKYAQNKIAVNLRSGGEEIVDNVPTSAARLAAWMESGDILTIHSVEPNLEQVFLTVTGRGLA